MSLTNCNVSLLAFTPEPELLVCLAARRCRSDKDTLDIDTDGAEHVIERVMEAGHLSVLEHVNFTFAVDGISLTVAAVTDCGPREVRYTGAKALPEDAPYMTTVIVKDRKA